MAADQAYWAATEDCIVCQRDDFATGEFGPRTLVTCDCCLDKGVHVECWHQHSGELVTPERLASPAFQWFCCEVRVGGRRRAGERLRTDCRHSHPAASLNLLSVSCRPAGLQASERGVCGPDRRAAPAARGRRRGWRLQVHSVQAAAACCGAAACRCDTHLPGSRVPACLTGGCCCVWVLLHLGAVFMWVLCSVEVARWSHRDRKCQQAVGAARNVLKSAFGEHHSACLPACLPACLTRWPAPRLPCHIRPAAPALLWPALDLLRPLLRLLCLLCSPPHHGQRAQPH